MISIENNSPVYFGVKLKFIPYFIKKNSLRQIATKTTKKKNQMTKKKKIRKLFFIVKSTERNMLMYKYIQTHIVYVKLKGKTNYVLVAKKEKKNNK
jgi:hypothetical protein